MVAEDIVSKAMQPQIDGLRTEMSGFRREAEIRFDRIEKTLRNIAVTVAHHEGHFVEIREQLKKLDVLDEIQKTMAALAGEVASSRAERVLPDKSFRDQQTTLTDHEVRIRRLERGSKPS